MGKLLLGGLFDKFPPGSSVYLGDKFAPLAQEEVQALAERGVTILSAEDLAKKYPPGPIEKLFAAVEGTWPEEDRYTIDEILRGVLSVITLLFPPEEQDAAILRYAERLLLSDGDQLYNKTGEAK